MTLPASVAVSEAYPSHARAVGAMSASRRSSRPIAPRLPTWRPIATSHERADSGHFPPWSRKSCARPWSAVRTRWCPSRAPPCGRASPRLSRSRRPPRGATRRSPRSPPMREFVRLAEREKEEARARDLEVARGERRGESVGAEVPFTRPRERAPLVEEIGHHRVLAQDGFVLPSLPPSAHDERLRVERRDADEVRPGREDGHVARRIAPGADVVGEGGAGGRWTLVAVARARRVAAQISV